MTLENYKVSKNMSLENLAQRDWRKAEKNPSRDFLCFIKIYFLKRTVRDSPYSTHRALSKLQ